MESFFCCSLPQYFQITSKTAPVFPGRYFLTRKKNKTGFGELSDFSRLSFFQICPRVKNGANMGEKQDLEGVLLQFY